MDGGGVMSNSEILESLKKQGGKIDYYHLNKSSINGLGKWLSIYISKTRINRDEIKLIIKKRLIIPQESLSFIPKEVIIRNESFVIIRGFDEIFSRTFYPDADWHFSLPHLLNDLFGIFERMKNRQKLKTASTIIANSLYTKKILTQRVGVREEKIVVIYPKYI